jgi:hypothetical protein
MYPKAHIELELDVFGVSNKLLKNGIHLYEKKILHKFMFSPYSLCKQQTTNSRFQGILRSLVKLTPTN